MTEEHPSRRAQRLLRNAEKASGVERPDKQVHLAYIRYEEARASKASLADGSGDKFDEVELQIGRAERKLQSKVAEFHRQDREVRLRAKEEIRSYYFEAKQQRQTWVLQESVKKLAAEYNRVSRDFAGRETGAEKQALAKQIERMRGQYAELHKQLQAQHKVQLNDDKLAIANAERLEARRVLPHFDAARKRVDKIEKGLLLHRHEREAAQRISESDRLEDLITAQVRQRTNSQLKPEDIPPPDRETILAMAKLLERDANAIEALPEPARYGQVPPELREASVKFRESHEALSKVSQSLSEKHMQLKRHASLPPKTPDELAAEHPNVESATRDLKRGQKAYRDAQGDVSIYARTLLSRVVNREALANARQREQKSRLALSKASDRYEAEVNDPVVRQESVREAQRILNIRGAAERKLKEMGPAFEANATLKKVLKRTLGHAAYVRQMSKSRISMIG